jgi:hypothetical protein
MRLLFFAQMLYSLNLDTRKKQAAAILCGGLLSFSQWLVVRLVILSFSWHQKRR